MERILKKVLKQIKPTPADHRRLQKVVETLLERVKKASTELKVQAKPMLVGSAARNTSLRTERDIDIFILFPEGLSRAELERQGLAIARAVAGSKGKEAYAEHPYVKMDFEGFDVDLVPCYDIPKPSEIRSAVDRSPHHQHYVIKHLTPKLAEEVLLAKQFMSGVGCYGAELKVHGFSGYLCELLVLYHGSFKSLVESACGWKSGMVIDPERVYPDPSEARRLFEGQPLIVVDPVDASRNVGAAVSMQNFATFVRACQDFVKKPEIRFFFPKPVRRLSTQQIRAILKRRGTALFCTVFTPPDVVPDVLYPQLRKAERTLAGQLGRAGFGVVRSDVWSDSRAFILLELAAAELPLTKSHIGPPISIEVGDFIKTHLKSMRKFAGPFVDAEGRIVFELKRERPSAREVLELALKEHATLGRHVGEAIAKGHRIYEGEEILKLCRDEEIREFVSEYLTRCLPWYR